MIEKQLNSSKNKEIDNDFVVYNKTLDELEQMLVLENWHWEKYAIWKTNPYNVENIKGAIEHLKKTEEVRTTSNFYFQYIRNKYEYENN